MSRRPVRSILTSRFQAPDWLFRVIFGPGVVLLLVIFTIFISRNEPAPQPSALQLRLQQQTVDIFQTLSSGEMPKECIYSIKFEAVYGCAFSASAENELRISMHRLGWVVVREHENSGFVSARTRLVEFSKEKQRFTISCNYETKDCRTDLVQILR